MAGRATTIMRSASTDTSAETTTSMAVMDNVNGKVSWAECSISTEATSHLEGWRMARKAIAGVNAEAGRSLLLARRSELIAALTGRPTEALIASGRLADDDQATVLHDEFVSLEMNRMALDQVRRIDAALELIADGDYGVCQDCGGAISSKRLTAVPWARYCIRCEERLSQSGAPGDQSHNGNRLVSGHTARDW